MLLYTERGRLKLLRFDKGGSPTGEPATLSPSGARDNNPAVAADGRKLWLAWDRMVDKAGSVMVRTAVCTR